MAIIRSVAWYELRMEALLPNSLRDIADAIGFDKVMLIVREYGGQRLWIPKQPTLDWALLPIFDYDFDAAYKLAKLCGGSQLEIPSCKFLELEERNQRIRCDRATHSIEALAKKYNLYRGSIRKILRCDTALACQRS